MSHKAYQKIQGTTEDPRSMEYRLFAQVTHALIAAGEQGRADIPKLVDSIDWNRRVWSALAAQCIDPDNKLPEALRAQIISISLWVSRYSSEVVQQGASLEPLIDVNKSMMAGLAQRPSA
jgi:flagellar protein FlaF